MSRLFVVLGFIIVGLLPSLLVYAGPREAFLRGELTFIDFQNPAPDSTLSSDARIKIKDRFSSAYNRSLAFIVRLEHEAGRLEQAIGAHELASNTDQLRTRLAFARTRLGEAHTALDSLRGEFERLLVFDPQTTVRTRMGRIRTRFEKEVVIPMRSAHTALVGIALTLKDIQ